MKPKVKAKLLFSIRVPRPPKWLRGPQGMILATIAVWVFQVLNSFWFFASRDLWSGLIWAVSMWCAIMAVRQLLRIVDGVTEEGYAWHSLIEMIEESDSQEEFKAFLASARDRLMAKAMANGCKGEDCDGDHEGGHA